MPEAGPALGLPDALSGPDPGAVRCGGGGGTSAPDFDPGPGNGGGGTIVGFDKPFPTSSNEPFFLPFSLPPFATPFDPYCSGGPLLQAEPGPGRGNDDGRGCPGPASYDTAGGPLPSDELREP